jgi:hypothetical protein
MVRGARKPRAFESVTLDVFKDAAPVSLLFSKMPQIGVLDHHQRATDKPSRTIKRSVGQMHVRRCAAEWIIRNVLIRMLPVKPIRAIDAADIPARPFVPEKLPANIDYQLGLIVRIPALANQIRFRPIADQRRNPAY